MVVGVGALGQAHAVKAALMGAGTIIAIDRSEKRLELTSRLAGAHAVPAGDDAREAVLELTGGEGADLVVDATGFPDSFGPAVSMARDGGTVIEVVLGKAGHGRRPHFLYRRPRQPSAATGQPFAQSGSWHMMASNSVTLAVPADTSATISSCTESTIR